MQLIDTGTYVSELTKRTLQQFGWAPGDPIPVELSDLLSVIKERTPATKTIGVLVDIAVMSDQDVTGVKNLLAAAKEFAERERNSAKDEPVVDPNIAQLQRAIRNAEAASEAAGVQIVDDRAVQEKVAEPASPQEPAANDETELPEPPPRVADTLAPPVFCPRCNWDTRQIYDVEITDFDKEAFMAVTLGGERFKKSFSLLGDRYSVTFRGLFAEENTIIHHQLLLDQKDGDFLSDTEWFLRMFEYRLTCSIESVEVKNQIPRPIPELHAVNDLELPNKSDDKTKAPLVRLREYVLNDLLKSELTRRMVGTEFRRFQRLYEALEAMAVEPSFW